MPVSRGFNRGGGIPLFSGMTAVIFALFIATPSFAEPTELDKKTVASKAYVDTQDALKQDKITAGTEGSVVTYDGTDENGQAVFYEREIYEGADTYTKNDEDKLITAGLVQYLADTIESTSVEQQVLTGVDTNGSTTTCQANDSCELWQISTTSTPLAATGTFSPLTAAAAAAPSCLTTNQACADNNACCSGNCTQTKGGGFACQ